MKIERNIFAAAFATFMIIYRI